LTSEADTTQQLPQLSAHPETSMDTVLRLEDENRTDLSRHTREDLAAVAAALNSRPRKTLGWRTPSETLNSHLLSTQSGSVATTP
jgi:hypothetical protein